MAFKDISSNNSCPCDQDLPSWFKQYMRKFKKKLLQDLRSNISEIVHEEFLKEKKLAETKLFKPDKIELLSPTKQKNKKKNVDKDMDSFEKRKMKTIKKIEKLCSCNPDCLVQPPPFFYLQKLESRTVPPIEKKKTVLERGHKSKARETQNTCAPEKNYVKSGKFTLLTENYVFLILQPGAEFSFTVNILNNGTVPWMMPRMECFSEPEISVEKDLIHLPRLEPGQNVSITLRGKVTQKLGHYSFSYKLFDGLEEFGPLFSCFAIVSDSKTKNISNSEQQKAENKAPPPKTLVGTFTSFENLIITSNQKKIEENITEIERRLQDIDLLRPSPSSNESKEERLNDNEGEFQVRGCDSMKGKEGKHCQEKLEEEVRFELDPLEQDEETEKSSHIDGGVKSENSQSKENKTESDSDSELSVIFMSEDENFIMVSVLPESSNSETVDDATKPSDIDLTEETDVGDEKPKEDIVDQRSVKVDLKEVVSAEVSAPEDFLPGPSSTEGKVFSEKAKPSSKFIPVYTKAPPPSVTSNDSFKENIPGNVPAGIFEETNIATCNIKVKATSNGSPFVSCSTGEIPFSRNTKEQSGSHGQSASSCSVLNPTQGMQNVKMSNISGDYSNITTVPMTDRLGKPIYAVRNDGYCLSVRDLVQNEATVPDVGTKESKGKTGNEDREETDGITNLEDSNITRLPNGMRNSASNVAAMAFNTAKFMFSNLQSAFKPEVEIRASSSKNQKPCENPPDNFPYDLYSMGEEEREYVKKLDNQEKYIDGVLVLHEMGFVNNDLNFRLLKKYDSQVGYVISEILDNPPMEDAE